MLNIHALNSSYTQCFSINVDFVAYLFVTNLGVFNYYLLIKTRNPSKSNLVTYKNTFSMRVEAVCISIEIETGLGWREKCIKNGRQNMSSNKSFVSKLGLRNFKKQPDVIKYKDSLGGNILCLQETHWTENDFSPVKNLWQGD